MAAANPYASEKSYASSNLPFGAAGVGEVVRIAQFVPRYRRITLTCDRFGEIGELNSHTCTARLFFPRAGSEAVILPSFEADPETTFRHVTNYIGPIGEVTRVWTMRYLDRERGEADFDFFMREGSGLGLDWAKRAKVGDRIGLMLTKSGGSTPGEGFDRQILFADEAAIPHVSVMLRCLPASVRMTVILEIGDADDEQALASDADVEVIWVHRGEAEAGTTDHLKSALQAYGRPEGRFFVQGFGEARLITEIRRFLRDEWGLDHRSCRVSGFWRRGKDLTEAARIGYARVDAMAAQGVTLDEEAFSKFLEYD
jgi:NADPH-dependent ferric siderophore reductase